MVCLGVLLVHHAAQHVPLQAPEGQLGAGADLDHPEVVPGNLPLPRVPLIIYRILIIKTLPKHSWPSKNRQDYSLILNFAIGIRLERGERHEAKEIV